MDWTDSRLSEASQPRACARGVQAGANRWFASGPPSPITIAEDRLRLYAQRIEPLDDLAAGIQYEILVRMLDPAGRLCMPGSFMPAAERYGLAEAMTCTCSPSSSANFAGIHTIWASWSCAM